MFNIGHKLLLSSLVLIVGASAACSEVLGDFQKPDDTIAGLRGSIGMGEWEKPAKRLGGVFIPDIAYLEQAQKPTSMVDDNGNPLDLMATGSIGKAAGKKMVRWGRFDSEGHSIPNGLTD